jgi:hypothetical protein
MDCFRWTQDVRNHVNSCLDYHLFELQKLTPKVVDLHSKNVKWYLFVNFASNVVVLCYSFAVCHGRECKGGPDQVTGSSVKHDGQ